MSLATLLAAANFLEANNNTETAALTRGCVHSCDDRSRNFCEDVVNMETAKISDWFGQAPSDSTRQMHNTLEKNRRAVLKDCFDELRRQILCTEDRRSSNLQVLRIAVKHVLALQMEAVKLEQFQKRLLQRNSDLQQKLRSINVNEFEHSCVALSPSTDTAEDSPYESDNYESEFSISREKHSIDTFVPISVSHPTCKEDTVNTSAWSAVDNVTDGTLSSFICDPQQEAVTALASLSSCKDTAVVQRVPSQPKVATFKSRSLTDAIRVVKRPYKTSPSMKHPLVEAGNSHTLMPTKSSRTVVQLLQQSLVQRGAAQLSTKPRSRAINSKHRRHCSTIAQQIDAIKALEDAQSLTSAINIAPSQRSESTIIKSEVALSSGSTNTSLSSPSLLFALTNDKFTPTSDLLNSSMGQQKLFQVCAMPSTTTMNQSVVSLQLPSTPSSFILCPMMFSNLASMPVFLTGGIQNSTTIVDYNSSLFTTLQPLSMLQVPTVVQSPSIPV